MEEATKIADRVPSPKKKKPQQWSPWRNWFMNALSRLIIWAIGVTVAIMILHGIDKERTQQMKRWEMNHTLKTELIGDYYKAVIEYRQKAVDAIRAYHKGLDRHASPDIRFWEETSYDEVIYVMASIRILYSEDGNFLLFQKLSHMEELVRQYGKLRYNAKKTGGNWREYLEETIRPLEKEYDKVCKEIVDILKSECHQDD